MTKKETKIIDVVRSGKDIKEIITALKTYDITQFKNGIQSNMLRAYLECYIFNKFIENNEIIEKPITFEVTTKEINATLTVLPFILGVEWFEVKKQGKLFEVAILVKRPYGNYKTSLEEYGLMFKTPDKTDEEIRNAEQMEAIQEANSILASVGLKTLAIN